MLIFSFVFKFYSGSDGRLDEHINFDIKKFEKKLN